MDFDLFVDKDNRSKSLKKKIDYWTPIEDSPQLTDEERKLILYTDDVVDNLRLVKPACLFSADGASIDYAVNDEADYYFVAAEIKDSSMMVLYEQYSMTDEMKKFLKKKSNKKVKKDFYYLDNYFSPNFGMFSPKYLVFEKVEVSGIPNKIVLFKET